MELAVRVFAVEDADYANGFFVLTEADTVVADAQTEHWRVDALEFLNVDGGTSGEPAYSLRDSEGSTLIELRQIC